MLSKVVWTVLAVAALQQIWMACALKEGHVSRALKYYGVACHNQRIHAYCPRDYNLRFQSAIRTGLDYCAPNYTTGENQNCRLDLLDKVVTHCIGQDDCLLDVTQLIQDDTCPAIFKCLRIEFDCIGDGPVDHSLEYFGVACEDERLHVYCPRGYQVQIVDAMYGRTDPDECAEDSPFVDSTTCRLDIMKEVMDLCEGEDECMLSVDRLDLHDPCPGTSKYLQVTFDCAERPYSRLQCQGKQVNLECTDESLISVKSVFYGRLDNKTCSKNATILTNECSGSRRALSVIADLCDHKQECPVSVVPELLDDPCADTTKYLEVQYTCASCENLNSDEECEYWASTGECEKNYHWMLAFCRKTCTRCLREATCVDEKDECESWASVGQCLTNPIFMLEYCKYACNVCPMSSGAPPEIPDHAETTIVCEDDSDSLSCPSGHVLQIHYATYGRDDSITCSNDTTILTTDCDTESFVFIRVRTLCSGRQDCHLSPRTPGLGDPCPGTHKYLTAYHTCRTCENDYAKLKPVNGNTWCKRWEMWGECHENPAWMWENCFQACSGCMHSECANTLEETKLSSDVSCDDFALVDKCVSNRDWMEEVCLKSCRGCPEDIVTMPETPPTLSSDYITDLACEDSFLDLQCDDPDLLIYVVEGFYGRWDATFCSGCRADFITGCADYTFSEKAALRCSGLSQCSIEVRADELGDPCDRQTYKYANVSYVCVGDAYFTGLCPSGCGDHGLCVGPELCRCDLFYTGATCEHFNCSGSGCALSMTITLGLPWKDSYLDTSDKYTAEFIRSTKQTLLDFYQTLFGTLIGVEILKLSPGSVVVEHTLEFDHYLDGSTKEQYSCLITKSLEDSDNKIGNNITVYLDVEIAQSCTECHHGGVFRVLQSGFWYCQCTEGYGGKLCESVKNVEMASTDGDDNSTQTIVIIVIVAVCVLLLVGCVVLFVYIRRKNRRLQEENEDPSSAETTATTTVSYDRMAASATVEYPHEQTTPQSKTETPSNNNSNYAFENHLTDVDTPDILQC